MDLAQICNHSKCLSETFSFNFFSRGLKNQFKALFSLQQFKQCACKVMPVRQEGKLIPLSISALLNLTMNLTFQRLLGGITVTSLCD